MPVLSLDLPACLGACNGRVLPLSITHGFNCVPFVAQHFGRGERAARRTMVGLNELPGLDALLELGPDFT